MNHTFKVGDVVGRISGEHWGMVIGDIGTITEIRGSGALGLKEFSNYHDPDNFILHQPAESQTSNYELYF
jgi:hypothetical protein